MNTILAYVSPIYDALLVPFGTSDFGPKLATGLLALALLVLLGFIGLALPQVLRCGFRRNPAGYSDLKPAGIPI
jgi:hypothetical protein